MFLHTSPEFALKRVLASGLPRVYSISPCFREEEWGPMHTTEFTMVEWYRTGCGYREVMEDTVELIRVAAASLSVDISGITALSYAEAYLMHAKMAPPTDSVERQRIWVQEVEGRLEGVTVVYDYPADEAAFSEVRGSVCERFEVFWNGVELANAFTELLDASELEERWNECNEQRKNAGRVEYPVDLRLLDAVGKHPRTGGVALGLDRLLFVLLGLEDIRETQVLG